MCAVHKTLTGNQHPSYFSPPDSLKMHSGGILMIQGVPEGGVFD